MDRDRVPAGPVQRAGITAMPVGLIAFWWSVVTIDRSDGELGNVVSVGLVAAVVLGLIGMWVGAVRSYALGAALGVAAGVVLALVVAGGLQATSP